MVSDICNSTKASKFQFMFNKKKETYVAILYFIINCCSPSAAIFPISDSNRVIKNNKTKEEVLQTGDNMGIVKKIKKLWSAEPSRNF